MLIFKQPSMEYASQIEQYKQEFQSSKDTIDGSSFLEQMPSIGQWLNLLELFRSKATVPENYALSETWLVIRQTDDCLVGMSNLRFELSNAYLKSFGGHIGYSVRPNERKKGYGKIILNETLKQAKTRGIDKVLVTCNDINYASAKIIEANQGILAEKVIDSSDQMLIRRYWITI
ncbi:MAG TPA: GNAT family N-acetyltransferase [Enterococcus sp.]|nr:GNAT family N-acetyltransferase [Enterococcus sp.]